MEFFVLGPFEVRDDGRLLALGGGKQRAVLAVLLLHAGEVVSTERLIDALWGERPPASALNSVHIYVSQLRKALGDSRLVTRGRGYSLELESGHLDRERFERLLEEGRTQRRDGDPERAAETLRDALALWRGPALADLAYEPFAQTEIARLEELRLSAFEERIEADLEMGRHTHIVPELEALIREHPLRERPRAQLMLALYRSGRQADALEVYRDARRTLSVELGLEPGPRLRELEQAVLQQDPGLDAPETAIAVDTKRRRGAVLLATGGALLLAVVAAIAVALVRGSGEGGISTLAADSIGVVDAGSGRIVAQIPVAGAPARLASNGRSIWVGSDESGTIVGLDPGSRFATKLVAVGGFPSDLAVGEGAVWVVDGERGVLARVDPAYGTVTGKARVADPNLAYDRSREGLEPTAVAAGLGSVWTTDGSSTLTRVGPRTLTINDRINLRAPLDGLAIGDQALWAISGPAATAIRLDSAGRVTARIPIAAQPGFDSPYPLAIEAAEQFVWVLNGNTATVTKIDPEQRAVAATIPIGIDRGPARLAVGEGAAWVANGDGTIARIDAETNDVEIITVAHRLKDIAVGGGAIWVSAATGLSSRARAAQAVDSLRPLPASACAPIYYAGGGQPGYLIASDLQLQGSGRTGIAQMSNAIEFVLRERHFRAGRFAVGYQSCNDATLTGVPSEAGCERNGNAYANDPDVIGVIGPFTSGCAATEVPLANRAPGGPLSMISPSSTYVGLTHRDQGTTPGEPVRYFPSGRRSFVRVIPADDVQAAADALLARRLDVQRVFVVGDTSPVGRGVSGSFRSAAGRLGLTVAGSATWDYELPQPAAIAEQARQARADAVFIAACAICDPSLGALIRALRAKLGRGAAILATDGFSDFDAVVRIAGSSAEGMTVSIAGLPGDRLPAAGRAFAAAFGKAVGRPPEHYALYAAQAAEVLLDAIARSDGTRVSVTRELFETKVANGIAGSFSIDSNGDTTQRAVTIYRIVNGKPKIMSIIRPTRDLVSGRR